MEPYLHGTLAHPHHLEQGAGVTLAILLGHPISPLPARSTKLARLNGRLPWLLIGRLATQEDR